MKANELREMYYTAKGLYRESKEVYEHIFTTTRNYFNESEYDIASVYLEIANKALSICADLKEEEMKYEKELIKRKVKY